MKISNKRAFFDFDIKERIESGIQLTGPEVKAIRDGHADLTGSFARIVGSEAYLVNAKVYPYKYARPEDYDETRTRKLLLHKKEIISIKGKTEGSGQSIVPIAMYTKGDFIKVELGIGKGKKKYEKRASIKAKDVKRDIDRELNQ